MIYWVLQRRYLPDDAIGVLVNHKYASQLDSWVDRVVLDPMTQRGMARGIAARDCLFDWLVLLLIQITLLSFCHCLANFVVHTAYAPDWSPAAVERIPHWIWIWSGWNVWAYSFLDAIDGKQARRLGMSSPIGQLLDHGIDSLSCWMMMASVCLLLGQGTTLLGGMLTASIMCSFFAALWEESQTSIMRFGQITVTHGQLGSIAAYLIAGFGGGPKALYSVNVFGWTVGNGLVPFALISTVVQVLDCIRTVVMGARRDVQRNKQTTSAAANGHSASTSASNGGHSAASTAAPASAPAPAPTSSVARDGNYQWAQFLTLMILGGVWCALTGGDGNVFRVTPAIPVTCIGLGFSFIVARLILYRSAGIPFGSTVITPLWPLPAIVAWSYYLRVSAPAGVSAHASEWYVAIAYLLYSVLVYFHFTFGVLMELCEYLGIGMFTIPPPKPASTTDSTAAASTATATAAAAASDSALAKAAALAAAIAAAETSDRSNGTH